MALVGAESGAKGLEEEVGGSGAEKDSVAAGVKGQRSRRRLQQSAVQVGGRGEGPLESLSQVPLWRETETDGYMESHGVSQK